MYVVTCKANGRSYVGVSHQLHIRYAAHAKKPPRRMRQDARRYRPFEEHFPMRVVAWYVSRHAAELHEQHLTDKLRRTKAGVYNVLSGSPGRHNRQYRFLKATGRIR